MSEDRRPPVWVGHVVLQTAALEETEQFMLTIGMRPIGRSPEVVVLELRGGTHLILIANASAVPGHAPFDLMVEDLDDTHHRFTELGLHPSAIASTLPHHRTFTVQEPSGHILTFLSNHVSGPPV